MVSTLGEAHDLGWRITAYCRAPRREGMKSVRGCTASHVADIGTLIWTRGREFPISQLGARMKCPRCGSRQVLVAFDPPSGEGRARA